MSPSSARSPACPAHRLGAITPLAAIDGERVITTDTLVESVHFFPDVDPARLGHKSAAVNLSDLAAMGAHPEALTLDVACPDRQPLWRDAFERGARALVERHGAAVTVRFAPAATVHVSVLAIGRVPGGAAVLRSGAAAGDLLAVTGTPGDAGGALALIADGLFHGDDPDHAALLARLETPEPRVDLGVALRGIAGAMLDISDGLAGDCEHLVRESGVDVVIDADALPLSEPLRSALPADRARAQALGGGDDYELAVAVPPSRLDVARAAAREAGTTLTVVGRFEAVTGVAPRVRVEGTAVDATPWRHRFAEPT